jgi:hypothetical protein
MHHGDDFIIKALELMLEFAVLHIIRWHALGLKGLRGQGTFRTSLVPLRLGEDDGGFLAEFGGKNDHRAAVIDPEADVSVHVPHWSTRLRFPPWGETLPLLGLRLLPKASLYL